MHQRIGTCSLCGGDVVGFRGAWGATIPPPPDKCSSGMKATERMSTELLATIFERQLFEASPEYGEPNFENDYYKEIIRRAKLAESKADVIAELKSLDVRFLARYCEDLPHKENCAEEIFSADDFFYFINERIAILKGSNNGK